MIKNGCADASGGFGCKGKQRGHIEVSRKRGWGAEVRGGVGADTSRGI